jgi:lipopolysaccharide heptosyltransferase II
VEVRTEPGVEPDNRPSLVSGVPVKCFAKRFGERLSGISVSTVTTTAWTAARNLLCVRLDTLGDVLMTGPALRALRDARPDRRITLLTSVAGAGAGELMPEVDETMLYEAPWMKHGGDASPDEDLAMAARLRAASFDAAVVFTVYTQSALPAALLCHVAGIPLRLAHCRENPYRLLTDWVPEPEPEDGVRHEVRRQLDLVAAVGASSPDERLAVELPTAARERVAELLAALGVPPHRWVVLHPGASAASRAYPAEAWAGVCAELEREHGVRSVVTGARDEVEVAEAVVRQARAGVPMAGRLDLPELAALLEAAPLLIAGNTGPVHLAAAVGTPVVDVYALTNPQHTPWGVPSRVLYRDVPCRWCYRSVCPEGHHRCIRGVAPDEVVAAALSLLRGERPPPVILPPVPARTPRPRSPAPRGSGS